MKKISALLLLFLMGTGIGFAQLNEFKYFVVPKQFKNFDKPNKYKTSTLVKYLLVNNGMEAVYDDSQPPELILNPCMGLYLDLIDYKRLLTTEVSLAFNDCEGNEVFRTEKRKSSIKNFTKAFDDAIRKTFVQVEIMGYAYAGPDLAQESAEVEAEITAEGNEAEDRVVYIYLGGPEKSKDTTWQSLPAEKDSVTKAVLKANFKNDVVSLAENKYRAIDEGAAFRIEDANQQVLFRITPTLLEEVFLIQDEKVNGIVLKKNGKWFMEVLNKDGSHRVQWIDLSFQN